MTQEQLPDDHPWKNIEEDKTVYDRGDGDCFSKRYYAEKAKGKDDTNKIEGPTGGKIILDPQGQNKIEWHKKDLMRIASNLGISGKGILACDESAGTLGKRFEALGVENTHENRKNYRHMLFTAPGIEEHISGVILNTETTRDVDQNNKLFIDILRDRGIYAGVKVDLGCTPILNGLRTEDLAELGETFVLGLHGLDERMKDYHR